MDILDKMMICAVIGSLMILIGGFIIFIFVIKNNEPILGAYITIIGILIVAVGSSSIMIFEGIKNLIKG